MKQTLPIANLWKQPVIAGFKQLFVSTCFLKELIAPNKYFLEDPHGNDMDLLNYSPCYYEVSLKIHHPAFASFSLQVLT